jgi:hypothetical protein
MVPLSSFGTYARGAASVERASRLVAADANIKQTFFILVSLLVVFSG